MHPSPSDDVSALDSYLKDLADFVGHLGFDLEDGWRVEYRDETNRKYVFVSPSGVEYPSYVDVAQHVYGATPLSVEESRDGKITATWSRVVSIDARRQEYLLQDAAYVLKNGVGCFGTDDAFPPPGDDLDLESRAIIECDGCLRHFPPCDVDQGMFSSENRWYCPMCLDDDSKFAPMEDSRRSACSEFLHGNMRICSIEEIRSVDAEFKLKVRWYITPETTAGGRELFHIRREIFLRKTDNPDEIDVGDLRRHALVLPRKEFDKARGIPGYHAADDLFLCEYAYDEKTGRYEPLCQQLFELNGSSGGNAKSKEKKRKREPRDGTVQPQVSVPQQQHTGKFARIRQFLDPRAAKIHDGGVSQREYQEKKIRSMLLDIKNDEEKNDEETKKLFMFVTGSPGTGKTTTVTRVIHELQEVISKENVEFKSAHVDCAQQWTPTKLWNEIARKLFDNYKEGNVAKATGALTAYLTNNSKSITVVVLDEIDKLLLTKELHRKVFRSLLDMEHKGLILIGISNLTYDQCFLKAKTADPPTLKADESRIQRRDIFFPQYSAEELVKIVGARLECKSGSENEISMDNSFDKTAIQWASIKAVGGDVRKFFYLCCQATRNAQVRYAHDQVEEKDQKVCEEDFATLFESDTEKLINGLPLYQSLLLLALLQLKQESSSCGNPKDAFDQSTLIEKTRSLQLQASSDGVDRYHLNSYLRIALEVLKRNHYVVEVGEGNSPRSCKIELASHLRKDIRRVLSGLCATFEDREGISRILDGMKRTMK